MKPAQKLYPSSHVLRNAPQTTARQIKQLIKHILTPFGLCCGPNPAVSHVDYSFALHGYRFKSQRSAHELPMVEKQDIEGCSVMGGQQMILTGQNFASDAKVVFAEKTQDGQQIWDIEATVDKDKSQPSMLFVEVPPYRDPAIRHAVKVNFFVINGKRKRSQPQHFTYFPLPAIKTEPIDDCELQMKVAHGFATMQHSYYHPQGMINSETCFVASCQQIPSGISPPDSRSRAVIYPKSRSLSSSPLIYQQTNLMTSPGAIIQDAHCSVLVHTGSPGQSSTMIHQQSSSPSQPPSSIIQFSPTNHQIRGGGLSDHQHIMYCESFQNSPARSPAPAVTQTTRISTSFYPTVIQQQPYIQKIAKHRSPPRQLESQQCLEEQKEIPGGRVTVKQENLDQAYLDDAGQDSLKLQARHYKTLSNIYKPKPNQSDVAQILDLESEARWAFIDSNAIKEEERVTKIFEAYPCFRETQNAMDELRRILGGANHKYIKEKMRGVLCQVGFTIALLTALPSLFASPTPPPKRLRNASEALLYILQPREDPSIYLPLSSPGLIFNGTVCVLAVGNTPVSTLPKDDFFDGILMLMAYYYTLHLTYAKCVATLLSIIQTEVLGDAIHDRDATSAYKKAITEWKSFTEK
ncbi:NFAC2 factor, partial [Polypterus senegalus]